LTWIAKYRNEGLRLSEYKELKLMFSPTQPLINSIQDSQARN
jgi:hypothetical protein